MSQPTPAKSVHRRRGNTIIEAALVLPILLSVVFGGIEFGYYFYVKHCLQVAAREGARTAVLDDATNAGVTTAANNTLIAAGLSGKCNAPAITDTAGNAMTLANVASGTQVKITITANWGTIGQGLRPLNLISANKVVTSSVVMRKE